MSADALLSRLDAVRRTGDGRWIGRCPAHGDKHPSLSVREIDDGRILLHCFSGCSVEEILRAVNLTFDDLFPPRPPRVEGYKPERRPFLPTDVFEIARHEITIAYVIACDVHAQKAVSRSDYERLGVAMARLENIAKAAYGR